MQAHLLLGKHRPVVPKQLTVDALAGIDERAVAVAQAQMHAAGPAVSAGLCAARAQKQHLPGVLRQSRLPSLPQPVQRWLPALQLWLRLARQQGRRAARWAQLHAVPCSAVLCVLGRQQHLGAPLSLCGGHAVMLLRVQLPARLQGRAPLVGALLWQTAGWTPWYCNRGAAALYVLDAVRVPWLGQTSAPELLQRSAKRGYTVQHVFLEGTCSACDLSHYTACTMTVT